MPRHGQLECLILRIPLTIYGAAKIFEFAGGIADYQLTEEFSHMNLFSLQRGQADKVIILRFGLNDERATSLDAYLNANGIESLLIPIQAEKEHVLGRAVSYSIALQYLALNVARNRGLQRPAFLLDQERLEISNKMIYKGECASCQNCPNFTQSLQNT